MALIYLALAGLGQGVSGPTMTAVWAEIFGVESLGATKGTVATLGVFATALGSVLLGALLESGVPFLFIVPGCAATAAAVFLFSLIVRRRLGTESAAAVACGPHRSLRT